MEKVKCLGWWVISGESVLELLRRANAGESPDALYAEEYANAEHQHVPCGGCGDIAGGCERCDWGDR